MNTLSYYFFIINVRKIPHVVINSKLYIILPITYKPTPLPLPSLGCSYILDTTRPGTFVIFTVDFNEAVIKQIISGHQAHLHYVKLLSRYLTSYLGSTQNHSKFRHIGINCVAIFLAPSNIQGHYHDTKHNNATMPLIPTEKNGITKLIL